LPAQYSHKTVSRAPAFGNGKLMRTRLGLVLASKDSMKKDDGVAKDNMAKGSMKK